MRRQITDSWIFDIMEKMGVNRMSDDGEKIQEEIEYANALLETVEETISKESIAVIIARFVFKDK